MRDSLSSFGDTIRAEMREGQQSISEKLEVLLANLAAPQKAPNPPPAKKPGWTTQRWVELHDPQTPPGSPPVPVSAARKPANKGTGFKAFGKPKPAAAAGAPPKAPAKSAPPPAVQQWREPDDTVDLDYGEEEANFLTEREEEVDEPLPHLRTVPDQNPPPHQDTEACDPAWMEGCSGAEYKEVNSAFFSKVELLLIEDEGIVPPEAPTPRAVMEGVVGDFHPEPRPTFAPLRDQFRQTLQCLRAGTGTTEDKVPVRGSNRRYRLSEEDYAEVAPVRQVSQFLEGRAKRQRTVLIQPGKPGRAKVAPTDPALKSLLGEIQSRKAYAFQQFRRLNATAAATQGISRRMTRALDPDTWHDGDTVEDLLRESKDIASYAISAVSELAETELRQLDFLTRWEKQLWLETGEFPDTLVSAEMAEKLVPGTVRDGKQIPPPFTGDTFKEAVLDSFKVGQAWDAIDGGQKHGRKRRAEGNPPFHNTSAKRPKLKKSVKNKAIGDYSSPLKFSSYEDGSYSEGRGGGFRGYGQGGAGRRGLRGGARGRGGDRGRGGRGGGGGHGGGKGGGGGGRGSRGGRGGGGGGRGNAPRGRGKGSYGGGYGPQSQF